jgi:hypothetical protein
MVDGREQAIPMPNFNWQQISEARCIDWSDERIIGAFPYLDQVEFFREIAHPRPGVWELVDKFIGNDEHILEWHFHFAPGLDLKLDGGEHMLTVFKEGRPFITMNIPQNRINCQLRPSWYSYQYAVKKRNQKLCARWRGKLKDEGVSFHWKLQLINEKSRQH